MKKLTNALGRIKNMFYLQHNSAEVISTRYIEITDAAHFTRAAGGSIHEGPIGQARYRYD